MKKEEPKQETLEEAIERYYEENIDQSNIHREHYEIEIKDLIIGFAYKLQQQQNNNLYSKVIDLLERSSSIYYEGCDLDINYESEKSKIINQLKEII